jgi:hypothetical protein
VERYDPILDQWSTVAALNTPRSGACAVAFAGKIYVMGGASNRGIALNTCEVYHVKQDKWFYCRGMKNIPVLKALSGFLMNGKLTVPQHLNGFP